jgi:Protein of unknown function (DUF2587)
MSDPSELAPPFPGSSVAGGAEAPNVVLQSEEAEPVVEPAKLMRIASMAKLLLDEVRTAPLDEASRERMKAIYQDSIRELESTLSPELAQELGRLSLPFDSDTPSESELRVAQAQLVGWLEGLFQGIQATLFVQQMAAQRQLEQMRRRAAVESGEPVTQPPRPGSYL